MRLSRRFLLVVACLFAARCDLNPQPQPPLDTATNGGGHKAVDAGMPSSKGGASNGGRGGSSGGSGGATVLPPGYGGMISVGSGGVVASGGAAATGGATSSPGGSAGSSGNFDAGIPEDAGADAAPVDGGRGPDAATEGDAATQHAGTK